jgi:hypothetical protein
MKETGLMFKAPLVRAILSGQKTQTRRIAKEFAGRDDLDAILRRYPNQNGCPLGHPGDRIYVRETARSCRAYEVQGYPPSQWGNKPIWFEADGTPPGAETAWATKATPAIHLPKWAARIWLEVTGVRAERLQCISEADAVAEGCETVCMTPTGDDSGSAIYGPGGFAELWDSTTGRPTLPTNTASKRYARIKHWLDTHPDTVGWAANPWVWVIDFKRIERPTT